LRSHDCAMLCLRISGWQQYIQVPRLALVGHRISMVGHGSCDWNGKSCQLGLKLVGHILVTWILEWWSCFQGTGIINIGLGLVVSAWMASLHKVILLHDKQYNQYHQPLDASPMLTAWLTHHGRCLRISSWSQHMSYQQCTTLPPSQYFIQNHGFWRQIHLPEFLNYPENGTTTSASTLTWPHQPQTPWRGVETLEAGHIYTLPSHLQQ